MEECIGCCVEVCGRLILQSLVAAILFIVEKQIVQRREFIIRWGRRAQKLLHMPKCLRVLTEEDPGMLDGDIRLAGTCLSISYLFATMVVFCAVATGTSPRSPLIWVFGVSNPLSVTAVIWLMLIQSKRKRLCRDKGEVVIDRSYEEDVHWLWGTPCY